MNQKEIVLDHMREHGSITSMEAFELGITRLSAVIFDLRDAGWDIVTHDVTTTTRYGKKATYARYALAGKPVQLELL